MLRTVLLGVAAAVLLVLSVGAFFWYPQAP